MVQGLAFLSKKGFNPQNNVNRKQVWERQQATKQEEERLKQRSEQLRRERDDEELARSRDGERGAGTAQLRFMYDAPPGMQKEGKNNKEEEATRSSESGGVDVTQIQPGDDAAAAAFRRMLAAQSAPKASSADNLDSDRDQDEAQRLGFGPNLQGSNSEKTIKKGELSSLEKAVGRKDHSGAMTLEEQVERFPQLKHAPMAKGMSATDVGVAFKPLGAQIKNIKCLACGIWGHSKGDRECSVSGWDPFSSKKSNFVTAVSTEAKNQSSSIRPGSEELKKQTKERSRRRRRRREDDDDDSSSSSSSSSSSDSESSYERRRRQKRRKHRKSSSKRRHKSSSRKHRKRSRHDSDSDDGGGSDRRKKESRSEKSVKKPSRH